MPDTPPFFDPAEDCPWRTPRQIFAEHGYSPLSPAEINDAQLSGRLWELLYAAAGRRIYFHNTDHLSDREFYTWLWNHWLDHSTADIPLEAESNTLVDVSGNDPQGRLQADIWWRYYAPDAAREKGDPGEALPPHEDPPFDRDRFLPVAPYPVEAHGGWLPGDDPIDDVEEEDPDPLGLTAVEKEIAASKENPYSDNPAPDLPTSPLEAQLAASEPDKWVTPAQQLAAEEVPLLPPAEITEDMLAPILWELLHNLSLRGFYILHSDHLSDQQLYAELWERGLRDPAHLRGP